MFIFNFLFHNAHDKFDRQKSVKSNKPKRIMILCLGTIKSFCHHRDLNSQPRAYHSIKMFSAKYHTTHLSRRPPNNFGIVFVQKQFCLQNTWNHFSRKIRWGDFCKFWWQNILQIEPKRFLTFEVWKTSLFN